MRVFHFMSSTPLISHYRDSLVVPEPESARAEDEMAISSEPLPRPQTPEKLIIRVRRPKSPLEHTVHDSAQPDRCETSAAQSSSTIRRVRLIVRPPRSPSPELKSDEKTSSQNAGMVSIDSESVDTESALSISDDNTADCRRNWLDGDFFDSPMEATYGRAMKNNEGIYYMAPKTKKEEPEPFDADAPPIEDLEDSIGASTADQTFSPPRPTPDSTRGSTDSGSDSDSELEGLEFAYPDWTPPPSPPVKKVYHFFDFENHANIIDD